MLRLTLAFLALASLAAPTGATASTPDKSGAELPPCVTLPPMAKGKKCRELPTMAMPDLPRDNPRRTREMKLPPTKPLPTVAPQNMFGHIF
jgi:hypothetical protein